MPFQVPEIVKRIVRDEALREGMVTYSNIFASRIPRTEEPGRLHSPWDCKELDMIEQVTLSPSSEALPPGRQRSRAGSSGKGTPGSLLDISKDREVSQSLHQDDRLGSSPGVKAEVQGLGAAKASYWRVQSMEVSVLLWVSEHHFGRERKGRGRRCAWPVALGPGGVGRRAGGLRVRGESTHS